jgi:cytochrome P450
MLMRSDARGMLHDEELFPNPSEFRPERYLEKQPNGQNKYIAKSVDPRMIIFGYGRR